MRASGLALALGAVALALLPASRASTPPPTPPLGLECPRRLPPPPPPPPSSTFFAELLGSSSMARAGTSMRRPPSGVRDLRAEIVRTPPCNCTVFAYAHLRKCAGVSVRSLLLSQLDEWRWSGYCVTLRSVRKVWSERGEGRRGAPGPRGQKRLDALDASPRWFVEVHCRPELSEFVQGLIELRALLAQRGCALVSGITLRDPVGMLLSEFDYFRNDHEKRGLDVAAFAARKREYLLLGSGADLGFSALGLPLQLPPTVANELPAAEWRYARAERLAGGAPGARPPEPAAHAAHAPAASPAALEAIRAARLRADRAYDEYAAVRAARIASRKHESGGAARWRPPPSWIARWDLQLAHALQAAQLARARWLDALSAGGLLECGALLQRAEALLSAFDVLGFVERMDATLLLLVDALGLQHVPSWAYDNTGGGERVTLHSARWASLNVSSSRTRPSGAELRRLRPELTRLNACSTRLYARLLARFDAEVARKPAEWHARLKRMPRRAHSLGTSVPRVSPARRQTLGAAGGARPAPHRAGPSARPRGRSHRTPLRYGGS